MNYVFIAGCGHTGSSILARIIGEHSKIFFEKKETNLFLLYNHFNYKKKFELIKQKNRKLKKTLYLEKTNRHLWHLDFILKEVPKCKFILTTRKSFDVIGSLFKRSKNIESSIKRYQDDSIYTIRHLAKKNTILVKYEELIQKPEKTIKKIFKFLEIKYEKEVFNYYRKKINWNNVVPKKTKGDSEKKHDFLRSYQMNQILFDGTDTWKKNLKGSNLKIVKKFYQKIGKKIEKDLGY